MFYYLVYKIHFNPITSNYDKIIGFESKIEDTVLNNFIKPISIKPIENVGLTQHTCFYALLHPIENRLLTFNETSEALNILIPLNFTIDEILTKIEVKRRLGLVYVLKK